MTDEEAVPTQGERGDRDAAVLTALGRDFEALLDQTSDLVFFRDLEGRHRFVSQAVARATGHADWRLLAGLTEEEFAPGEMARRHKVEDAAIVASGQPLMNRVDETARGRWVQTSKWPVRDARGEIVGIFGIGRDITEMKKAEASLRDSESRYRRLIEHSPDVVYVFSDKRGGVFYSPRVEAVLGYSVDHLYAHPFLWNESIHPDDLPLVAEAVREFAHGQPYAIEYRVRHALGHWVWMFDRSISRMEVDGEVVVEGLATDVSTRKRIESALREAEREAQAQRRHLSEVIWGTDAGTWQWNIQTGENVLNDRWAEILGRRLESLPTGIENWRTLTHPDDLPQAEALLARCFRGELETYECELRMRHANGDWVWVLTRGRVVEWTADGKPLRMSGTHLDVSARRKAEAEREAMEAKLREGQRLEALGTVAGGIAHDFNNVLLAVLGNAGLAKESLQAASLAEVAECLDEIELAGAFAQTLVQQILAYTRRQPPTMIAQPLSRVVDQALAVVRMTLPPGADLQVIHGGDDLIARVDATQIGQVVLNLCTNASQALIVGHGHIEVSLHVCPDGHDACARLRVADTGRGMDEATRTRIFEPFFTTKPMGKGTGLGMAVVHGIVQAHGGIVHVESAPGEGTRIDVHLPLSQAADS